MADRINGARALLKTANAGTWPLEARGLDAPMAVSSFG